MAERDEADYEDVREWVSLNHTAAGQTSVKVSLQDGSLSVRWAVKTFTTTVREGHAEARSKAYQMLDELRQLRREAV